MTKNERIRRGILAAIAIIEKATPDVLLHCNPDYAISIHKEVAVKNILDILDAYAAIAGIKEGVGLARVQTQQGSYDDTRGIDTLDKLRYAALSEVYGLNTDKERAK